MADLESSVPAGDGDPLAAIEGYEATLQHIRLLQGKRDALTARQRAAEEQHLHRIAGEYRAGVITIYDLARAYKEFQAAAGEPGFAKRWEQGVGISRARMIHAASEMYRPNGPHGSWMGIYPFDGGPFPQNNTPVAYVLFDALNQPCYVGSTQHFSHRMRKHTADGKQFTYWHAYPCTDRAAAYALEDRLLKEHKPYLNKRAAA
jgi:hypothetical protein